MCFPYIIKNVILWQKHGNDLLFLSCCLLYLFSPFHTEIPENTRVMCSGICSRIVRFAAFTLPVIFRNMCVHSHTTRKDPVKTRDLSCDVYNAPSTISLNWRMISASARIVRSSLFAASF